ncbi:MAG: hypothetical protein SVG88_09105 [Halobacteriales archaeon]|nr:hypothetical protein [Halobacteriales archaeon]
MSIVPGTLETDQQPPMTVPLRHFVFGLGFLLLGVAIGLGIAIGLTPGWATLAHVHLLLVGWICLTIMGAMTQFVPVWSGVPLYSRRLAVVQLWPVVGGLVGFAASLLADSLPWLVVFGALMLVGFWIFVYNIGRTLWQVDEYDVTERHFIVALGFFLLLTPLGYLLAIDFSWPVFAGLPVSRVNVVGAHATLAVFGAVLTTVFGALYQLGSMFTQTELHGIDHPLQRVEETAYPIGVVSLAVGRLLDAGVIARIGGILIAGSVFGFGLILARRLYETQVEWTPMLTRYAVVVPLLALWSISALLTWIQQPLARTTWFGLQDGGHLLLFGVIGFVVFGTLYHIIPFIIWVHRYSEQLGFAEVPMIDDLYSSRIATIDVTLIGCGFLVLAGSEWVGSSSTLPSIAGVLVMLGSVLFVSNMLLVLRDHNPHSLGGVLFDSLSSHRG